MSASQGVCVMDLSLRLFLQSFVRRGSLEVTLADGARFNRGDGTGTVAPNLSDLGVVQAQHFDVANRSSKWRCMALVAQRMQ